MFTVHAVRSTIGPLAGFDSPAGPGESPKRTLRPPPSLSPSSALLLLSPPSPPSSSVFLCPPLTPIPFQTSNPNRMCRPHTLTRGGFKRKAWESTTSD
eukprot:2511000-Pyramimonas_sp.AAC.1